MCNVEFVVLGREAVDLLNTEYSQYYKHAIETDFSGDDTNWTTVKGLVLTR